jgi:tRNA modification GTPase
MQQKPNQVIFALATSSSRSALHIHRISGPGCWELTTPILRHRSGKAVDHTKLTPRHTYYFNLVTEAEELIDDVIVTFYPETYSYSGESLIEITSHGNPLIDMSIQSRLRRLGMEDARPGEFTQRAYFNGRLDLTQAESVAALVASDTFGGLNLARAGSDGSIERSIAPIRQNLVELRAQLEAQIDFAEDEVGAIPWDDLHSLCLSGAKRLVALEQSFDRGKKLREGLTIAIVGRPNAGKSSLYNAILSEDRALVSTEMGTTRDLLRERLHIRGRDFLLIDTAGVRETDHELEQLGISRGQSAARAADVVLIVVDVSAPDWSRIQPVALLAAKTEDSVKDTQRQVIILNKIDCVSDETALERKACAQSSTGITVLTASRDHTTEIESLLCQYYDEIMSQPTVPDVAEDATTRATLISARQHDATQRARHHLEQAAKLVEKHAFPEIIASEVIACEDALEELMGRVDVNEIFSTIFSKFCIGK